MLLPYTMSIDVKYREEGDFFYSFALEKSHKKEGHPPAILFGDAAQRAGDDLEEVQRIVGQHSVYGSQAAPSDTSIRQNETGVNPNSTQNACNMPENR